MRLNQYLVFSFTLLLIGCSTTKTILTRKVDFPGNGIENIAVVSIEGYYSSEAISAIEKTLRAYENVNVIPGSRVSSVLIELHLEQKTSFNPSEKKRLGQLLGVDAIIVGKSEYQHHYLGHMADGMTFLLDVQIIETETGRVLMSDYLKNMKRDNRSDQNSVYLRCIEECVQQIFWNKQ